MSNFNITGSKIEQLSDSGNNYKLSSQSGHNVVTESGNAVLTEGTQNKVVVDRQKDGFLAMLWKKAKAFWTWATG